MMMHILFAIFFVVRFNRGEEGVLTLHSKALAESIELDPRYMSTPRQRPYGNDIPINTVADHALLAVACQLVRYMPDDVCQVQSFSELYGGRLITDIIPETNHLDFNGELPRIDHTQEEEHGMRLHVDDVDHMLRAPWQLLLGIKNAAWRIRALGPCITGISYGNMLLYTFEILKIRRRPVWACSKNMSCVLAGNYRKLMGFRGTNFDTRAHLQERKIPATTKAPIFEVLCSTPLFLGLKQFLSIFCLSAFTTSVHAASHIARFIRPRHR